MIASFSRRKRLVHISMTVLMVWKLKAPRGNGIIKPEITLGSSVTYSGLMHDRSPNISTEGQENTLKYSCKLKEENTAYFDNLLILKTYRNI